MLPPYRGNCMCGQIQFRLNAEPLTLYACHCTDCQHRSGGALLLSMWVNRDSLEVLDGTPKLVSSIANDGRERKNKVCPTCEVRLWSEPVSRNTHCTRPETSNPSHTSSFAARYRGLSFRKASSCMKHRPKTPQNSFVCGGKLVRCVLTGAQPNPAVKPTRSGLRPLHAAYLKR
jgi:hypothetical protein